MGLGAQDAHARNLAGLAGGVGDMDRVQMLGLARPLAGDPARAFIEHLDRPPDHRRKRGTLLGVDEGLHLLQAGLGLGLIDLRALGRGRAGAGRVAEGIGRGIAHRPISASVSAKSASVSPG